MARNNNDRYPVYPASYNYSNVISVANLDYNGYLDGYSNYGKKSVLLAAPGTDTNAGIHGFILLRA